MKSPWWWPGNNKEKRLIQCQNGIWMIFITCKIWYPSPLCKWLIGRAWYLLFTYFHRDSRDIRGISKRYSIDIREISAHIYISSPDWDITVSSANWTWATEQTQSSEGLIKYGSNPRWHILESQSIPKYITGGVLETCVKFLLSYSSDSHYTSKADNREKMQLKRNNITDTSNYEELPVRNRWSSSASHLHTLSAQGGGHVPHTERHLQGAHQHQTDHGRGRSVQLGVSSDVCQTRK